MGSLRQCSSAYPHGFTSTRPAQERIPPLRRAFDIEKDDGLHVWQRIPHKDTLGFYGVRSFGRQSESAMFNRVLMGSMVSASDVRTKRRPSGAALTTTPLKKTPLDRNSDSGQICQPFILNRQVLQRELQQMPIVQKRLHPCTAFDTAFCTDRPDPSDPFGVAQHVDVKVSRAQSLDMERPPKKEPHGLRRRSRHCPMDCGEVQNACSQYEWEKYKLDPRPYNTEFRQWLRGQKEIKSPEPKDYDQLYGRFLKCFEQEPTPDSLCKIYKLCCTPKKPRDDDGHGQDTPIKQHDADGHGQGNGGRDDDNGTGGGNKDKDKDKRRNKNKVPEITQTSTGRSTDENAVGRPEKEKKRSADRSTGEDTIGRPEEGEAKRPSKNDKKRKGGSTEEKDSTNTWKNRPSIGSTGDDIGRKPDKGKAKKKLYDGNGEGGDGGDGKRKDKKNEKEMTKDKDKKEEESVQDFNNKKPSVPSVGDIPFNQKVTGPEGQDPKGQGPEGQVPKRPGSEGQDPKRPGSEGQGPKRPGSEGQGPKRQGSEGQGPNGEAPVEDTSKPTDKKRATKDGASEDKDVGMDKGKKNKVCQLCPPLDCSCEICRILDRRDVEPDAPFIQEMKRREKRRQLLDYRRQMCYKEYCNRCREELRASLRKCNPICCNNFFCQNPRLAEHCDRLGAVQDLQKLLTGSRDKCVNQELLQRVEHLRRSLCQRMCESILT